MAHRKTTFINTEKEIGIPALSVTLKAKLGVPRGSEKLVIFVHGTGSSRFSPRNNYVAETLRKRGLASLLFDLLTEEEDRDYAKRFDIDLITDRLLSATEWVRKQYPADEMLLQYFGASTGSAAALRASVCGDHTITAIVSRGGRPDMVSEDLPRVKTPTLFIVGGNDFQVKQLNEEAFSKLSCERSFEIIPGATHLFTEEGALEELAKLSADWFEDHP